MRWMDHFKQRLKGQRWFNNNNNNEIRTNDCDICLPLVCCDAIYFLSFTNTQKYDH